MEAEIKEPHKRSRTPTYKKKFSVDNWTSHNQSLCNRGALTLSIAGLESDKAQQIWKTAEAPYVLL